MRAKPPHRRVFMQQRLGEPARRTALRAYVEHFHGERNHQGKGTLLLFPCEEMGQHVTLPPETVPARTIGFGRSDQEAQCQGSATAQNRSSRSSVRPR